MSENKEKEEVIDWEAKRRQREERRRTVEGLLRPLDKATLARLLADQLEWDTDIEGIKSSIAVSKAAVKYEATIKVRDAIDAKMATITPAARLSMFEEKLAAIEAVDAAHDAYMRALDRQARRKK